MSNTIGDKDLSDVDRFSQEINRRGMAANAKGKERQASILDAARNVFMQGGYSNFSMRKIAAEAGISIGNLNYYYPKKEPLLRDMLDRILETYMVEFDRVREAAGPSPRMQLAAVLHVWIDDLAAPNTTVFFPEFWALANHDAYAAELLDTIYGRARQQLTDLIPKINPTLNEKESEHVALLMCAAMEGLTIFAGHEKPWSGQLPILKIMLIPLFFKLIDDPSGSKTEIMGLAEANSS